MTHNASGSVPLCPMERELSKMSASETETGSILSRRKSLSQEVADLIKQQMIDGDLNPGDRIVETKLAKELGVSQTPIREAIRLLAGEGIVKIISNKGPIVQTLGMDDIFEIYSIRAMLEGLAIRMATQTASDDEIAEVRRFFERMLRRLHDDSVNSLLRDSAYLHASIVALSRHSRLIAAYKSLTFQILFVNKILAHVSTKQKEVDQHLELVEALEARDPDCAERTMRGHIYRSYCEFAELEGEDIPSAKSATFF